MKFLVKIEFLKLLVKKTIISPDAPPMTAENLLKQY